MWEVKKSFIYKGKVYNIGQKINEKDFPKELLEKWKAIGFIDKITKARPKDIIEK